MEKRTAILYGGSAYNIQFSLDSQLKNLIIPNNADVFVATTRYCKRRKTEAGEIPDASENDKWNEKNKYTIVDMLPLSDYEIQTIRDKFGDRVKMIYVAEDNPDYMEYIRSERYKMMNAANYYIDKSREMGVSMPFRGKYIEAPDNGNVRCVVDQYRHIRKAYQLMEDYEKENDFKYDYVMRARIDFVVPEVINIEHYSLNHDEAYLYCLGSFRRDPMEWADEFCWFSKRSIAAKLFPALDRMGHIHDRKYSTINQKEDNDFMFDPETQFSLLLHELNMPVVNVRIYRSACYTNGGDGYDYMNYKFRRDPINLEYEYELVCKCASDINQLLPTLKSYAERCDSLVEIGVRWGNSTVALMMACKGTDKKFISYDVTPEEKHGYLELMAKENNINWELKIMNPTPEEGGSLIPEADFLFVDTNHNCDQLALELAAHPYKIKRYMVFHDVHTYWENGTGYDGGGGGMKLAMEPFLAAHPEWKIEYRTDKNNGLLILQRHG